MNLLINFLKRFTQSPKTTLGGLFTGATLSAVAALLLQQSGCQFSNIQWFEVLSLIIAGPTVVGGMSTDNGVNADK